MQQSHKLPQSQIKLCKFLLNSSLMNFISISILCVYVLVFYDSKCCKLWIIVSKTKCLFVFLWSCYYSGWFPCCGYFWPFLFLSKCLYVKFRVSMFCKSSHCWGFLRFYITLVLLLISFHELWCLLWHWLWNTSWGTCITTTH
jgi:hypothetical protein